MIAIRKVKVRSICARGSPIAIQTAFERFDVTAYVDGTPNYPRGAHAVSPGGQQFSRFRSRKILAHSISRLRCHRRAPVARMAFVFRATSWFAVSL